MVFIKIMRLVAISILVISTSSRAFSQTNEAVDFLEEVIAVGQPREERVLESSVSVSLLPAENVVDFAPRDTAEIFRTLPGVRAESSGGRNANLTVRGIPLATGGSKFMQIHEDGLPVVEFGDINFGNQDNWLAFDYAIEKIESIRGGSASTFASNSPGGIINLVSKTGEDEGGSVGFTLGADYEEYRADFEYGGPINDELRFHIGGFVRTGEGVRETGFNGYEGGQIKANITRDFDNGYLRLYFKHLDDRVSSMIDVPIRISGGGSFEPVPGFNAAKQNLFPVFTQSLSTFDSQGNPVQRDTTEGIKSTVDAFGLEAEFELADGWLMTNKFRVSDISGGTILPFADSFGGTIGPQPILSAQDMGDLLCSGASDSNGTPIDCSAGVTVTLANGPNAGMLPSDLLFLNLFFDTTVNDLGLTVNDLKFTKDMDNATVSFGLYTSRQNIDTSWNSWQARIQTVSGASQDVTVVANANNDVLVDTGVWTPAFLSQEWDLDYMTVAPYINFGWDVSDALSFDISVRRNTVDANGQRIAICCGGTEDFDLNQNGIIEPIEDADATSVFFGGGHIVLNNFSATPQRVNYKESETSFSIGGNYLLNDDSAIFARFSRGHRALADRLLQQSAFTGTGGATPVTIPAPLNPDGSLVDSSAAFDEVEQLEVGYKLSGSNFNLFATLFDTTTDDANADFVNNQVFVRTYEATGIELEGGFQAGGFSVMGNLTWTDAEIVDDIGQPRFEGNTPRRQADLIYTITPRYTGRRFDIGATLQGSSEYFLADENLLKQEAYVLVHAFGSYTISDVLSVSLNINNLTDEFIVTEVETGDIRNGLINQGDFVRGRPVQARSTSITLKYAF